MIKSIKLLGQNISNGGACFYKQGTPSKRWDFILTLFAKILWAPTGLFHKRAANTLSTKTDRKCHKLVTRHTCTPLIEPDLCPLTKTMRFNLGCTLIDNEYASSQWSKWTHKAPRSEYITNLDCDDTYSLSVRV